MVTGWVTVSDWAALPPGSPVTVFHNSQTVATPGGQIQGRAQGTFQAGSLAGEYHGEISAQPGGPAGILAVEDRGVWTASDGSARGTFHIELLWNDSFGTLVGTLTLDGTHD